VRAVVLIADTWYHVVKISGEQFSKLEPNMNLNRKATIFVLKLAILFAWRCKTMNGSSIFNKKFSKKM
jgi:hypothetical protein